MRDLVGHQQGEAVVLSHSVFGSFALTSRLDNDITLGFMRLGIKQQVEQRLWRRLRNPAAFGTLTQSLRDGEL